MARCFYADKVTNRRHDGMLTRCAQCREVICSNCIGRNMGDGTVLCFKCSADLTDPARPRKNAGGRRANPETPATPIYVSYDSFRPLVHGITNVFSGTATFLLLFLRLLARPFNGGTHDSVRTYRLEGDLRWITERQRVQFVGIFALVIVAILVAGMVYAYAAEIPTYRFLMAVTAALVAWGISSIYLRLLFGPLGEPFASIFAYITAFLIALMLGIFLINWEALDRMFSGLM